MNQNKQTNEGRGQKRKDTSIDHIIEVLAYHGIVKWKVFQKFAKSKTILSSMNTVNSRDIRLLRNDLFLTDFSLQRKKKSHSLHSENKLQM